MRISLLLASFFILFCLVGVSTVSAEDIYVNTSGWWVDSFNSSSTPIQDAIDNATAEDTVIVRDGTYIENVDVDKQLTIRSENGSANCIVDAGGSESAITLSADGVNVTGVTTRNSGNPGAGIYLTSSNNNTITNNNITNNENGISLWDSSNNTITNNNISSNDGFGIHLYDSSENNTITNNNITNNGYGIQLDSSSNNTITSNNVSSNNNEGISSWSSSENNTIKGNNITNNSDGIELDSSSNNTITSNNITNNDYGIQLQKSSDNNTITSNNISSNDGFGIYLYFYHSSENNTIKGNNITNNSDGIVLDSSSSNTITNNNITNNGNGTILKASNLEYYDPPSNNTITSNNISNNVYGISLWDLSDNNTIKGNNITDNSGGIILDSSSSNTITSNNVSNNLGGIGLGSSSSNTITSNTVSSNKYEGIQLLSSSDNNTIKGNNITNNRNGTSLKSSNNNNIISNTVSSNNYGGIILESSSDNNTIKGNNVSNNYGGIGLGSSSNNNIYLNNFDNENNAYSSGSNIWNSTERISYTYDGSTHANYLGNYWSDYQGSDGDGIGDTPYDINGDGDCDYNPLINRSENYVPEITSCNNTGVEKNQFGPGETVYVKGCGLEPNTEYKIWIQDDPVVLGDSLVDSEDPSGSRESIETNESGCFDPIDIWSIDSSASPTYDEYDIVADKQDENSGIFDEADGIDDATVAGFVAPVPELSTFALVAIGLAGIVLLGRRGL